MSRSGARRDVRDVADAGFARVHGDGRCLRTESDRELDELACSRFRVDCEQDLHRRNSDGHRCTFVRDHVYLHRRRRDTPRVVPKRDFVIARHHVVEAKASTTVRVS
jgi:hypothetical protein